MKKNTLLYLDARLVANAKQCNLNLSKITENAVKSHLFPILSIGEKADADFWEYLKDLEKEKCAFFLPVRIKQIKLANIGPISNLTIGFKKFNIVTGKNASGKTTIIRSIAQILGHEFIKDNFSNKAIIELEVHPETRYKLSMLSANTNLHIKSVLIDCGGYRLDNKYLKKFIMFLKKLDMQVIMTEHGLRSEIPYEKINIINL
jgi:hypothetical protein|tara:strand:+ start:207 stop:818 length:612 start_codon:yes stop_codon:yes gene_type:complete